MGSTLHRQSASTGTLSRASERPWVSVVMLVMRHFLRKIAFHQRSLRLLSVPLFSSDLLILRELKTIVFFKFRIGSQASDYG